MAGVLAVIVVLGVGAWLALGGTGGDGDIAAFCSVADTYFTVPETLPGDPDAVRAFVDERVAAAARVARDAPDDIRKTASAHAADVAAARGVFERRGYARGLVNEALSGTLDPPEDVPAVLRVLGYGYSGDAAAERAAQVARFRDEHCHEGSEP